MFKRPDLVAEVLAALPAFEALASDLCGNDGVREVILRRMEIYQPPHREEWQWTIFWADYEDTLRDVPYVNLEAGFLAYVRDPTSKKMPFPGQLLELSRTTPNAAICAWDFARRLEKMTRDRASRAEQPREPLTEGEREHFDRMMDDYRSQQEARRDAIREASPKPGPPIHDPLVGGITPQLRRVYFGEPEPENIDVWPT